MVTRGSQLWRFGWLALCSIVLVWHSLQYNFVTDDAYISFVYARNLAEHGALVFNPGDRVEGYTNFLWTVLLGLLMLVGLAPEITSLVLGTTFALGTLVVAYLLVGYLLQIPATRDDQQSSLQLVWPPVAPALLSLSAGFACWSSGGLETQLFTFLVTAALYAYVRSDETPRWLRAAGLLLALAAMTRPEGLLITAFVGVHRLAYNILRHHRLMPNRDEMWCLGIFLLVWAPWYAWRWWYYGYPFPNTYYVKAAGTPPPGYTAALMQNGLHYVWQWARQSQVVYAAPIILTGLLLARPTSRRGFFGTLAAPLAVGYLIYTVRVGGDFMGLHRFVMPLFVIAAVACALGLAVVTQALGAKARLGRVLGALLPVAVVAAFAQAQIRLTAESVRWGNWASDRGIDTPAFLRVYAQDRAAIGAHMRDCLTPDDFSIVGGAGAQPYAGRMRAIDVFGLVSREIAHEVPPTRPRAGHNKWGPDRLLRSYDPDFVFSCYSIHRHPARPKFNCNPGFWRRHGYEMVTLHIPALAQQGQYYSFFKREERTFQCAGMVAP